MTENDVLVAEAMADVADKLAGGAIGVAFFITFAWIIVTIIRGG